MISTVRSWIECQALTVASGQSLGTVVTRSRPHIVPQNLNNLESVLRHRWPIKRIVGTLKNRLKTWDTMADKTSKVYLHRQQLATGIHRRLKMTTQKITTAPRFHATAQDSHPDNRGMAQVAEQVALATQDERNAWHTANVATAKQEQGTEAKRKANKGTPQLEPYAETQEHNDLLSPRDIMLKVAESQLAFFGLPKDLADDLVQDATLSAWEATQRPEGATRKNGKPLVQVKSAAHEQAYAYRFIRGRAIDLMISRSKSKAFSDVHAEHGRTADAMLGAECEASARMIRDTDAQDTVRYMVAECGLNPRLASALRDGCTIREVAKRMDWSKSKANREVLRMRDTVTAYAG